MWQQGAEHISSTRQAEHSSLTHQYSRNSNSRRLIVAMAMGMPFMCTAFDCRALNWQEFCLQALQHATRLACHFVFHAAQFALATLLSQTFSARDHAQSCHAFPAMSSLAVKHVRCLMFPNMQSSSRLCLTGKCRVRVCFEACVKGQSAWDTASTAWWTLHAVPTSACLCRPYNYQAQPEQGAPAWPSQRQGNPFRSGSNPFKGGGKWKHDLFEELTQPSDEAKPAATVETTPAVDRIALTAVPTNATVDKTG